MATDQIQRYDIGKSDWRQRKPTGIRIWVCLALLMIFLLIFNPARRASGAIFSFLTIHEPVAAKAGLIHLLTDRAMIFNNSIKHKTLFPRLKTVKLFFTYHYAVQARVGLILPDDHFSEGIAFSVSRPFIGNRKGLDRP